MSGLQSIKVSPLDRFKNALPSPESQDSYPRKLKLFLEYLGLTGSIEDMAESFVQLAKKNGVQWVQDSIISYFDYLKKRVNHNKKDDKKGLRANTVKTYYFAVKLFCEMNEDELGTEGIKWKRLSRGFPRSRTYADDRAPTIEELCKLVEYPDRRIKPLVYTMCSSGIRLGGWEHLQWKHVERIPKDERLEVKAGKLTVYDDEQGNEEYETLITPEAYNALKALIKHREDCGEKITGDSPLMRDKWQETNVKHGAIRSLASNPKRLRKKGITRLLNRALWAQGLRQSLPEGKRRHEWKETHGFRKYFETHASQVMLDKNVNKLLNHHVDFEPNYYRPLEDMVVKDYLKAVPLLTINDIDKSSLQTQVAELTQKTEDAELKKNEFEEWKRKVSLLEETILTLSEMRRGRVSRSFIEGNDEANDRRHSALEMVERVEEEKWEREAAEKRKREESQD